MSQVSVLYPAFNTSTWKLTHAGFGGRLPYSWHRSLIISLNIINYEVNGHNIDISLRCKHILYWDNFHTESKSMKNKICGISFIASFFSKCHWWNSCTSLYNTISDLCSWSRTWQIIDLCFNKSASLKKCFKCNSCVSWFTKKNRESSFTSCTVWCSLKRTGL